MEKARNNNTCVVVFSTDYPPLLGGIATYSYQIAKNLAEKNTVVVMAPSFPDSQTFDEVQKFSTLRVLNLPILREAFFFFRLQRLHAATPIDYIYNAVWFPCGIISYFLNRWLGIAYVIAAHGSEILDDQLSFKRWIKSLLRPLKRRVLQGAAMICPISHYTMQKLLDMGASAGRMTILGNGADIHRFCPGPKNPSLMAKYGIDPTTPVLLTVSRLDLHKGHDMVIAALPLILKKVPDLVYMIVGDGPEKKRLEELIVQRQLTHTIRMVNYVAGDELPDYYRLCDVFIMPSREMPGRLDLVEGFGIAYVEAAACAKPAVGGRSGGVPDAVLHEQTGLLVDPSNPEEIAGATLRLLTDSSYAKKLGLKGRERCEKELNWPAICGKFEAAWRRQAFEGRRT